MELRKFSDLLDSALLVYLSFGATVKRKASLSSMITYTQAKSL